MSRFTIKIAFDLHSIDQLPWLISMLMTPGQGSSCEDPKTYFPSHHCITLLRPPFLLPFKVMVSSPFHLLYALQRISWQWDLEVLHTWNKQQGIICIRCGWFEWKVKCGWSKYSILVGTHARPKASTFLGSVQLVQHWPLMFQSILIDWLFY